MNEPLVRWEWVIDHLTRSCSNCIPTVVAEHLKLTVIAVAAGTLIAIPVAVYAYRHRWFYPPLTWFTGFLYTIPSLALFVLLIPVTGLGTLTAEIGLVSYTLLILIRNTVAGLRGVPQDAKEAAVGMGLTRRQVLARVELPLALPAIVAGIRIATVTTIGLVMVTAFIGAGGLGRLIREGLQSFFPTPTIVGSVLCVALALAGDVALLGVQRVLVPWTRARRSPGAA